MFKNQKGSALVLSLMVLAVCTVLGVTFISINFGENMQSINEENRLKAYYIARSAAHSSAEWLLNTANLQNITQVVPGTAGAEISGSGTLEGFAFTSSIGRSSGNVHLVIIKGMASVGDSNAEAIINVNESGIYGMNIPFENAIFSHSNITLTGNTTVVGGVEAGGVVNYGGSVEIIGPIEEGSEKTYPPWVLTDILPDADPYDIQVNNGSTIVISDDTRYGTILVKNGGTLQFLVTGGDDLKLMADIIDMRGIMEILGEGTLKLYVNDGSSSQRDFDVSGGVISNSESLIVYMAPGSEIRLPGGSEFNGFIYGPSAVINLNGTPGYHGAMIGGEVRGVGTSDICYEEAAAGEIDPDDIGIVRFSPGMWVN